MSGLKLYTSNRLEVLARELARVLKTPGGSALTREIVVVQSKGMEKWVRMELARELGVSANLDFPFPNRLMDKLFYGTFPELPEDSLYDPDVLTWNVMGLIPSVTENRDFEGIRSYLGEQARPLKRYQLSERIADLFDQYQVFRPEMTHVWEEGRENHWQAQLWRELVKRNGKTHRAALQNELLKKIRGRSIPLEDLPARISVFGVPMLPPYHLEVLGALAGVLDVNLFVMNPCKEYWADIVSEKEMERLARHHRGERNIPLELHLEKGNSLLASMGALGRDFFSLTTGLECEQHERFETPGQSDLLSCIQSDILFLRDRGTNPDGTTLISSEDRSVSIHCCHSPMREMEVLHDHLLEMFERDPELEPKDIVVMTPDIEQYAPFVQALFGTQADDEKKIPFGIADRSAKAECRAVDAFLAVLDLFDSRFCVSEVLSLLEFTPVGQKFHLSGSDLPLIHRWIQETRIRWGIDAENRKDLGLPPFSENTWRFGLDRLLLGYALPGRDEGLFKGILPYDRIEGSETSVLGRFVQFLDLLFVHAASIKENRTLEEWAAYLMDLLGQFFASDEQTERDLQVLRFALHRLTKLQSLSRFEERIPLEVVKTHLGRLLERSGFGFGFLTGRVTFCAMLPMRSIPFKVICLVGMNDDAYPRQSRKLGFDLMLEHPRPGDRSRRKDDRYLFLEAILSARKALYISYVGRSPQDNSRIPPSVVVSELLDYIEQGFTCASGAIRDRIVMEHRLQAFNPAYFRGTDRFFSYSEENYDAAWRTLQTRRDPPPFVASCISSPSAEWRSLEVEQFVRFFAHPIRFLLKERLRIGLERTSMIPENSEPFLIKGLDRYQIEQMLLAKRLTGWQMQEYLPAMKASGQLPHGAVGECIYRILSQDVEDFTRLVQDTIQSGPLDPVDVNVQCGGFHLAGRITNIFQTGVVHYRYTKLKARDHLRIWIIHLLVNGFAPEGYPRQSILLGKGEAWRYEPVAFKTILEPLLEIYMDGLLNPVHFFPESSFGYAQALVERGRGEDMALQKALDIWNGSEFNRGEREDEYHRLCFGKTIPLDDSFRQMALIAYEPLLRAREKFNI